MPTATETPAAPPLNEIDILRKSNVELLEKSRTRKTKIAELEASNADLAAKLATAETALSDLTIGAPLRQLAATVSAVPDIWQVEFAKHYKLEMREGKLTVLTVAGEPVLEDGKPVPFEPTAIVKLLTSGDTEDAKTFRHITAGSLSSGGGAAGGAGQGGQFPTQQPAKKQPTQPKQQFGLR